MKMNSFNVQTISHVMAGWIQVCRIRLWKFSLMQARTLVFRQSTVCKRTLASLDRRRKAPLLRIEQLEFRNLLASWVEGFGGAGNETTNTFSSMDPSGNMYVIGQYNSQPADFDPGPGTTNLSSLGGFDAFAAKYASDGSIMWARNFGGTYFNDDARASVYSSEPAGNFLYVTGIFSGTVNFGGPVGNLTSAGAAADIFLVKLDVTNGYTVWSKRIGGTSSSIPTDIAMTHDLATNTDKVHVTGRFQGTTDFDPGPGTVSRTPVGKGKNLEFDGFLLTLDTNGNYVSVRQFGGSGSDDSASLETDGTSLFLVGNVAGTVDLDPGTGVQNASGSFIAKYASSTSASPTWVQSTTGVSHVAGEGDALYVTGGNGATVAKYTKATGAIVWSKQFSGSGTSGAGNIIVDPLTGSLYVTGYFSSSIDFNPGVIGGDISSQGSFDAFLLKLNSTSGDYQQVTRMGGTGNDRARVLGLQGTTLYVSGFFEAVADFPTGGTLTSSGGLDIFLMAFDQPASAAPLLVSARVFPDLSGSASLSVEGIVDPSQSTVGLLQSSGKLMSQLTGSAAVVLNQASTTEAIPFVSRRLATKRTSVDSAIADEDLIDPQHTITDDLFESILR